MGLPSLIKPRVSHCALNGLWILSPSGRRHRCSPGGPSAGDEGYRSWATALDHANAVAHERIPSLRETASRERIHQPLRWGEP